MNVLHVSRTMGQGGAEKIVYQLCMDNDCFHQCVASVGGVYVEQLEQHNVRHYFIPDIDRKSIFVLVKTIATLQKIVKQNNIDVVHTHHRMAAFYTRILQLFNRRLGHVYTAHNVFFGKKILLRFALQKAKIVAVGEGVKKNLQSEYGIKDADITVIHNAVDTRHIVEERNKIIDNLKSENKVVIGVVGRISFQKGMDIFVKAMANVVKMTPSVCAVIVGDGELRNELVQLVKDMRLEDNIFFLGYQSNVLAIIKQLEFIVLPSRWEGLPLTPIETFSQGKTIIATDISGNNEIIQDGYNGLLFPKDDVQSLAQKIVHLVNEISVRTQMEGNAKYSYDENYTYEKFISSYSELYSNM